MMHADGDWQAVEGVLSKDMATIGEDLQTWKIKISTRKTVSAVFHLNNKEAKQRLTFSKHELKVNYNNKISPFCPKPKCDWMPASYTSGQPSHPRRHPTC